METDDASGSSASMTSFEAACKALQHFSLRLVRTIRMRVVTILTLFLAVILGYFPAAAQSSEVTIILNEQFFDGLLDAAFQNAAPPQFSLAKSFENDSNPPTILRASYDPPAEC